MKKVLIISSTLRINGNSELLAKEFQKGALEAGNEVEFVTLRDKNISFCKGCFACQKLGKCVINDDANQIVDKMSNADVIVWSTPTYYYSMSGQMKTLIDRANSLYCRENKFKDVYLLITATEDEDYTPKHVIGGVQGWIDCFEGVTLKDTLFVGGVTDPNDILKSEKLKEAYNLGRSIK